MSDVGKVDPKELDQQNEYVRESVDQIFTGIKDAYARGEYTGDAFVVGKHAREMAWQSFHKPLEILNHADKVMRECLNAPNLSPIQKDYLINMAYYRHQIHAHPEIYWDNETNMRSEIDSFFINTVSEKVFQELDFPFPRAVADHYRNMIYSVASAEYGVMDKDSAVNLYATNKELLNNAIETFLGEIDNTYDLHLKPTGKKRGDMDCHKKTVKAVARIDRDEDDFLRMSQSAIMATLPRKKKPPRERDKHITH